MFEFLSSDLDTGQLSMKTYPELTEAQSLDGLLSAAHERMPALIIVDLHAQKCDPFALAASLKSDAGMRAIPLVGFFSHVQIALMRQAQAAGFERVMPRSAFTKQLPEILQGSNEV